MSKAHMDLIHDKNIEINRIAKQLASAKAEIERLQAHNAMLVEGFENVKQSFKSTIPDVPKGISDEDFEKSDAAMDIFILYPTFKEVLPHIRKALNSTPESTQQWLSEKIAQARKDALIEAAEVFKDNGGMPYWPIAVKAILVELANEVKAGSIEPC